MTDEEETFAIEPIDADPAAEKSHHELIKSPNGQLLTFQQLSFINHFFSKACMMNGTKAIVAAGYVCKTKSDAQRKSHELMKHAAIRTEIELRVAKIAMNTDITAEGVLNGLWDEANNHVEDDSSPAARVNALRTLSQHFGLNRPNEQVTGGGGNVNINIKIQREDEIKDITIDGEAVEVKDA